MKKTPPTQRRAVIPPSLGGFSLVEILVTMAVVTVLATLASATYSSVFAKSRNVQCLGRMKTLGSAILLYAQDNGGEIPRSMHSAGMMRKDPWAMEIRPYLGESTTTESWERVFNTYYRCPEDKKRDVNSYSYGLNVFYELSPDGDDYVGSPATWRRLANVPRASQTILLAEPRSSSYADHIMCHMWSRASAASTAVDATRHRGKTSNFVFADGHVESLPIADTYNPDKGINLWNPSLAKK